MTDKAGKAYWDAGWEACDLPPDLDLRARTMSARPQQELFSALQEEIAPTQGMNSRGTLLEIGCARSQWLPVFSREFGFDVAGLDYSEIGCQQARHLLARAGIDAPVVCADLFNPPEELLGTFDVVTSFGVVEHFEDTNGVLRAMSRLAKDGGKVITVIPNMRGALGFLQKRLINRSIYDIHVPLSLNALARAHAEADLRVTCSRYVLSTNFGILNTGAQQPGAAHLLRRCLVAGLARVSIATWHVEDAFGKLPGTEMFSPYLMCVATKSPDAETGGDPAVPH